MSPVKYVSEAVRNCAAPLAASYSGILKLPKKRENQFKMGYGQELNISSELEPDAASYFQTVMDILRWIIELERVNKITEVSLLSSHVALPRGHLDTAVPVMAHVGQRYNSRLLHYSEIECL